MSKVKIALGAELDILNAGELDDALGKHSSWEREAAFGLRHADLPLLQGNVDNSGVLALGGDQADGKLVGPPSGFYWSVRRLSVEGLAANEQVKIYKEARFVCTIQVATSFLTFSKGSLVLKSGDYLRMTGTGLTNGEQLSLYGEYDSIPGPLVWKILS